VPGVRDWLDRFRPAGAPGAATATGVPVDRREAARAELEPVFAALAGDIGRAAQRREAMITEAVRRGAEGRDAARALIAHAQASAAAERTAEETRLHQLATAQARIRREQASNQAQEVRERAARRPALVAEVLARELDEAEREEAFRLRWAGSGSNPGSSGNADRP
jgi:hypothetical protein